jgi:hypothetical protein
VRLSSQVTGILADVHPAFMVSQIADVATLMVAELAAQQPANIVRWNVPPTATRRKEKRGGDDSDSDGDGGDGVQGSDDEGGDRVSDEDDDDDDDDFMAVVVEGTKPLVMDGDDSVLRKKRALVWRSAGGSDSEGSGAGAGAGANGGGSDDDEDDDEDGAAGAGSEDDEDGGDGGSGDGNSAVDDDGDDAASGSGAELDDDDDDDEVTAEEKQEDVRFAAHSAAAESDPVSKIWIEIETARLQAQSSDLADLSVAADAPAALPSAAAPVAAAGGGATVAALPWEASYFTLALVEKLLTVAAPALLAAAVTSAGASPLFDAVAVCMHHTAVQVRMAALRVLATVYSSCDAPSEGPGKAASHGLQRWCTSTARLTTLCRGLCALMGGEFVSDDMSQHIGRVLVPVTRAIVTLKRSGRWGKSVAAKATAAAAAAAAVLVSDEAELGVDPLYWIFRRFASLTRRVRDSLRLAMLDALHAAVGALTAADVDVLRLALPPLMRMLYFLTNAPERNATTTASDCNAACAEAKGRALELYDALQTLDGTVVRREYANEATRVTTRRNERKATKSVQMLLDPEAGAKRRLSRNRYKRKRKQERMATWKGPRVRRSADDE